MSRKVDKDMTVYKIHNIIIKLEHIFNDYFAENIEKYSFTSHDSTTHYIEVFYMEDKELINGNKEELKYITHKKIIDEIIHVYHYQNGSLTAYVVHDLDYHHVSIYLNPKYPNNLAQLEYVISGIYFLEIAMHHGYFPFHASAIAIRDEVILITAPSGTGKSTHAKFWIDNIKGASIINDDKPLIYMGENRLMVHGSPFSGEHRINQNKALPLKAIINLHRGHKNHIEPKHNDTIIPMLIKATLVPKNEAMWDLVLPIMNEIYNKIPVYDFYAEHHASAATYLYQYFYEKEKDL